MSNSPTPDRSKEPPSPSGWTKYYAATEGRPPRPTLLFALDRFGAEPHRAADLGCGDGRDTIELLRRGWSVIALDSEPTAIARLRGRADLPPGAKLDARCESLPKARIGARSNSSIRASPCRSVRPTRSPGCGKRSAHRWCPADVSPDSYLGRAIYGRKEVSTAMRSASSMLRPCARSLPTTRSSYSRKKKPTRSRRAARPSTGTSSISSPARAERLPPAPVPTAATDDHGSGDRRAIIIRRVTVAAVIGAGGISNAAAEAENHCADQRDPNQSSRSSTIVKSSWHCGAVVPRNRTKRAFSSLARHNTRASRFVHATGYLNILDRSAGVC